MPEEKIHKIHLDPDKALSCNTNYTAAVTFQCPRCETDLYHVVGNDTTTTTPAVCKCFTWDLSIAMTGVAK